MQPGGGPPRAGDATTAHFSFCQNLLEHTVSAENLNYRLQRNPGSSLTWHDGRSQRPAGGRTVKLLQQPGTEGSQSSMVSTSSYRISQASLHEDASTWRDQHISLARSSFVCVSVLKILNEVNPQTGPRALSVSSPQTTNSTVS